MSGATRSGVRGASQTAPDAGVADTQILVAGLARSGTTWLGKLLDSHPATLYRHEPDRPPLFPALPVLVDPDRAGQYTGGLRRFAQGLRDLDRVRAAGALPVFRKHQEGLVNFQARRLLTVTTRLAARHLGDIRLLDAFGPPHPDRLRVLWKSVRSVGRLGLIAQVLRPINVVLLIRHPCGVIVSRQRGVAQRRMAPVPHAEMHELLGARSVLARRLRARIDLQNPLEREAFRWAILNSKAIEELAGRPGCLVVRYEDLCAAPIAVMERVLQAVGLPWDAQVERFIERSTASTSTRFYGLYRRPESTDPWRRSIPEAIQRRVLEIVHDSPAGDCYCDR